VSRVNESLGNRWSRRLNVVSHREGELDCDKATGAERLEWDRRSCTNIFEVLDNNSRHDHETAEMSEEAEKNHANLIEDNMNIATKFAVDGGEKPWRDVRPEQNSL
jgi:hypothetical protein